MKEPVLLDGNSKLGLTIEMDVVQRFDLKERDECERGEKDDMDLGALNV